MCICLVGAEAIVGTLAANKALTTSQSAVLGMAASPVQALDMLTRPTPTSSCHTHFVCTCYVKTRWDPDASTHG